MKEAHEIGTPIMRTMFYQFPNDSKNWELTDQYMYGERYLVAPVLYAGAKSREVYLPKGYRWRELESGSVFNGGTTIKVALTLETMPVFEKI